MLTPIIQSSKAADNSDDILNAQKGEDMEDDGDGFEDMKGGLDAQDSFYDLSKEEEGQEGYFWVP